MRTSQPQINSPIRILFQSHLRSADRIERALNSAFLLPLPSAAVTGLNPLPLHTSSSTAEVPPFPLPLSASLGSPHARAAHSASAGAAADASMTRRSPLRSLDAASAASAGESLGAVSHSLVALTPPPVPAIPRSSADCEQARARNDCHVLVFASWLRFQH